MASPCSSCSFCTIPTFSKLAPRPFLNLPHLTRRSFGLAALAAQLCVIRQAVCVSKFSAKVLAARHDVPGSYRKA